MAAVERRGKVIALSTVAVGVVVLVVAGVVAKHWIREEYFLLHLQHKADCHLPEEGSG